MFTAREGCDALYVMYEIYVCDTSKGNQIESYVTEENKFTEFRMPYPNFKTLCDSAVALPITSSLG